jgi:hypothetical protein
MSFGSQSRRVASVFVALGLVALAGCHAMPVTRLAPTPNRPQSTLGSAGRAALLSATVAMDPPSEMSSIEPASIKPASITPAESPAPEPDRPAATPLLDAALIRAQGQDEPAPAKTDEGPKLPPPVPEPSAASTPTSASTPIPVAASGAFASAEFPAAPVPAPEPEPARPEDAWRDGVRKLVGLARARLEATPANGPVAGPPWGLRARVLAWLAEPDLDPELGQRESDGVRAVLRAIDDSPGDSPRRGDEVRSAVLVLEDKAPFEITDLRFCSRVDGFGDFEAFEPPVRKAGQPVILYCEIDGLRFEQTSGGFRTRVAAQLEILAQGGGQPIHTRPLEVAEETCRRRRRDYYVAYKLVLPRPLEPGDYRIRLTARDLATDRTASREVAFGIAKD